MEEKIDTSSIGRQLWAMKAARSSTGEPERDRDRNGDDVLEGIEIAPEYVKFGDRIGVAALGPAQDLQIVGARRYTPSRRAPRPYLAPRVACHPRWPVSGQAP